MEINKLLELDGLAKEDGLRYSRRRQPYFDNINSSAGGHFTGIVGPRGAGKTVILKQIANQKKDSFYISVDTLEDADLFEIAKALTERYGVRCLLLDEVHFRKDFERELKKVFDFLNVRVIFTSSVALAMERSGYDLSRRVELIKLFPFSFREFVLFKRNAELPPLTIKDVVDKKWKAEHLKFGYLFEEYLKGGLHPFLLNEIDFAPLIKNILQKIITRDIPTMAELSTDEIPIIEKLVEFVGKAEVDGINYTSLSKNLGITKYKAGRYVELLNKSFILNTVMPFGTNVLKEPKVLMSLPYRLLFKEYGPAIGPLREDFFAEAMTMSGRRFFYLKSSRGAKTPDFLVQDVSGEIVIEVGGKGKGRKRFKDLVSKEKIVLTHSDDSEGDKRPLFIIGYQ